MFEIKTYYNLTMIMLILTFYQVEVQQSELGNRQTGDSCVKHRPAPPTPSLPPLASPASYQQIIERKNSLKPDMVMLIGS